MTAGWQSDFPEFTATAAGVIQGSLENFVRDFSPQQKRAWQVTIPMLQQEAEEVLHQRAEAAQYSAVLEYQLPYEGRRPDAVVLAEGTVVVLELKGKTAPSQADIDQVAAYARDLRAYHRECHDRPVFPVLVPTQSNNAISREDGVFVSSPDKLDALVNQFAEAGPGHGPLLSDFLDANAYKPLPSLVQAARELFESRTLREIWRAKAKTDPAVEAIAQIAHQAAHTRSRHLVLITGVPGAGKTLVGMRAVHANYLDDLAVSRVDGKPTSAGLYLTGNGPLSEVLQYELRQAGGDGRTFVRHVKWYLDRYLRYPDRIPPEHLLVFDEAQRAFNPDRVADIHNNWPSELIASEPELFVRLASERIPEWAVLVGLIGGGQEIHLGEEEGLMQWRHALEASTNPDQWTVHLPDVPNLGDENPARVFEASRLRIEIAPSLNLDTELRFHSASELHRLVHAIFTEGDAQQARMIAERVIAPDGQVVDGLKIYITRDLDEAKAYIRERYSEWPAARFGLLASSRDRDLPSFGIRNDWQSTRRVSPGPWFTEGEEEPGSCRHLTATITEFQCQGLELEMALVAWGTDLIREGDSWTTRRARGYAPRGRTRPLDPYQMRINAYRVLLTRGRDGMVVFVPPLPLLDETYSFLVAAGFVPLNN
ncbi:MAG: DUF2075 domain-containing protein [Arenicellales bacterium]|jgi:hypothetical protein|nr:DUF2075 domain-containing protein [Arenicellales bacterium]MDP6531938.1 DUF2075 domain-containing protein [Arenicellales bacterium]|tara:strand:+ start:787 stop:2745 length:1959 start_codon:yes stop_codon:yes gene_type:complete